jgi:hypothetical protein
MTDFDDYDPPDNSLFDNTTTVGTTSDGETLTTSDGETLTTFEDILRTDRVYKPIERSDHSRERDDTAEALWETQAFIMRTQNQVNGFVEDTQINVNKYVKVARKHVDEYVKDLQSEEQQKARKEMADKAVSVMHAGIGSCNDSVDAVLMRLFDEPLREVEVYPDLDVIDSVSDTMTDEMTLGSELTRLHSRLSDVSAAWRANISGTGYDLAPPSAGTEDSEIYLVPLGEQKGSKSRQEKNPHTSEDREGPETEIKTSDEDEEAEDIEDSTVGSEGDPDPTASETIDAILSSDSDDCDDSVLRFKEALYRRLDEVDKSEPPMPHFGDEKAPSTGVEEIVIEEIVIDLSDADVEDELHNQMPRNEPPIVGRNQQAFYDSGLEPTTALVRKLIDEKLNFVDLTLAHTGHGSFVDCIEYRDDDEVDHIEFVEEPVDNEIQPIDLTMYENIHC